MSIATLRGNLQQIPDGDIAFLLALAAAFLAVLTMAFFFMYLRQERRLRRIQHYTAHLKNTGNVAASYDIRIEETSKVLSFELYHQNELLIERNTLAPVEPEVRRAAPSVQSAVGAARQAGSLGSSLMTMLPQPLAKPLAAALKSLSSGAMAASRADAAVKAGKAMGKKAGTLMPQGTTPSKQGSDAPESIAAETPMKVIDEWFETPSVAPGSALELTLFVDWQKAAAGQRYPYKLISQASNQPDTHRLTTNGVVALPREAWWVQALPVLFGVSATVAGVIFIMMVAVTITLVL